MTPADDSAVAVSKNPAAQAEGLDATSPPPPAETQVYEIRPLALSLTDFSAKPVVQWEFDATSLAPELLDPREGA